MTAGRPLSFYAHGYGEVSGWQRPATQSAILDALLEEMKADLVSLFTLHRMALEGAIDDALLRAVRAGGIRRTLQNVKPRRDQPYQTMQLAQFNYFLAKGLLAADPATARLTIDSSKYMDVVTALLGAPFFFWLLRREVGRL